MQCQLADREIYYEISGSGKPLVTLSGIPSDHQIIKSWLEPIFVKRPSWQRIYFDLPGTGHTPGKDIASIEKVLDIACEFIERICPPGGTFTLAGLSAGGYLARGVIQRIPQRVNGLALLVPWLAEHDENELPAPTALYIDPHAIKQLTPEDADRLAGLAVVLDRKLVDWYRTVVIAARQHSSGLNMDNFEFIFPFKLDQRFDKPTLILTGRQDTHVGYRDAMDINELYPRASLVVLDRAGHALGLEQETLFRALINNWLDRVEEDLSLPIQ